VGVGELKGDVAVGGDRLTEYIKVEDLKGGRDGGVP